MKSINPNKNRKRALVALSVIAGSVLAFNASQSFATNKSESNDIISSNPIEVVKERRSNLSSLSPVPIITNDDKPNVALASFVTSSENEENISSKRIKLGLLLDTSSSMDGLINQAQSQLWKIVNELSTATCDGLKPTLEIALYEYGNDGLNAREGYIRMVTPLTNDLDQISSDLFSLTTNGGSEFCGHVIQTATNQLDWGASDADLKLLFIAGNEGFDQGSISPKTACNNANNLGITINTIYCGDINEGLNTGWKQGADLTAGHFMSISHNTKTVYIETPYDDQIEALNSSLNDTYVPYGGQGAHKKSLQISEDNNADSFGKQNKVSRVISKNSHVYNNASWDLVDAYNEKDFDISKIENKTLPDSMKDMVDSEKIEYIKEKKDERKNINKQISGLNIQRIGFIAEKKKEMGESEENSLDLAMIKAIKEQATEKAFFFRD